jgi:membrane protein DedA with SNARE-associated domain
VESDTLLSHFAEAWAYITLGASAILTEEAAAILGGFAAHEGHLGFVRVVLACALGTWLPAVCLYALGRWRGRWVRKRFPGVRRYLTPLLVYVRRSPWQSVFAVRFAFGIRIVLPVACGAARLRMPIYLIGTAVAAVLWASTFVFAGWLFGQSAVLIMGHLRRYEDAAAALILVAVLLVFLIIVRRRRARRIAQALKASEDPTQGRPPLD